jgi:pilus assembly protein CpaF
VGVIDQIARRMMAGPAPLRRADLEVEARRLLRSESPLSPSETAERVVDLVMGLGPIEPLLRDRRVTDVLVNGPGEIWVEESGSLTRVEAAFSSETALISSIERVIAPLGLRIDRSTPSVDARLPDGSRLHAVVPPACVGGPVLAIRRFNQAVESLADLVSQKSATEAQVEMLTSAVVSRKTLIVSGGTGSGKTTLLNLLAKSIPSTERIVTIEDAAELSISGHVVRLEARPPNAEGAGEITIRSLLRSALRLRPDRIIVGEVRGPEALDLVSALNTGHRGSLSTVHANSPEEAMWRLETLALSAGATSETAVRRQLHSAVDLVVQVERLGAIRRVADIAIVDPHGEIRTAE